MKTNDQSPSNHSYPSQALTRALDILDCFSYQNRELSLTEIVERTRLNKTTVKRLLYNLTGRNYLQQDPQTRLYRLGIRLFELGGIVYSSFSLRKAANSHLTHLRDQTGLTVLMGIPIEDHLVYVEKLEAKGIIQISSSIGWRRSLHFGMLGMVLMAYLPQARVDEILAGQPLQAYTPFSITDPQAFSLRLAEIRKQGSLVEHGEAHEGIIGIAAPVHDYSRDIIAAVGVALPMGKIQDSREINQIVAMVKAAAEEVSNDMGYLKI